MSVPLEGIPYSYRAARTPSDAARYGIIGLVKTAQPGHVRPAPVERTEEQARLEAFAAAVADGPCAVLVRGEPGIGKTTLWRHGVERVPRAPAPLLLTRPAEEEMPLPRRALVDLLRARRRARGRRGRPSPFGGGRAVLDDAARARRGAARCVLAIDDVQWLDAVSARSLRYALRRLDDASPSACSRRSAQGADAGRAARAERGAAAGPVRRARSRAARRSTRCGACSRARSRRSRGRRCERIHEVSGGNPLYAIELARGLGGAARSGAELPLPESIQSAIARRLEDAAGRPRAAARGGLGARPR